MVKFDVYCDSGANIPLDIVQKRDIHIISYNFTVNGEERACYDTTRPFSDQAKEFYALMRNGAEVKTSLLSPQVFIDAVVPSLDNGRDVLISIISSGISGTFNQALQAANELKKAYPERKIIVTDSQNASMGEGLQVIKACDLRDMGEDVETCERWIIDNRYKINSYLTVGDLKYLKKTGRISSAHAIAGTILNIKPVLMADGGEHTKIVPCSKVHGRKRALEALAENFAQNAVDPANQTVAICHADCEEDALTVEKMLREKGAKNTIVEYYDLCTGSHVGPGTVAIFFYGKDRQTGVKPKAGLFGKLRRTAKQTN